MTAKNAKNAKTKNAKTNAKNVDVPQHFTSGQDVSWTSQSAGITKTKTGKIVEVLPPGKRPKWKDAGGRRDHVSYIVQVGIRRYWPRVSQLRCAYGMPQLEAQTHEAPEAPEAHEAQPESHGAPDGPIEAEATPDLEECIDCEGSTAEGTPDPHVCADPVSAPTQDPKILVREGDGWRQYLVITDRQVVIVGMIPTMFPGGWRLGRAEIQGATVWPNMSRDTIVEWKLQNDDERIKLADDLDAVFCGKLLAHVASTLAEQGLAEALDAHDSDEKGSAIES